MPRRALGSMFPALAALAGTAFGLPAVVHAAPGDTKSFVLLHTNDQHGHLLPFSYPDKVAPGDDIADLPFRKDIGGIARRATLIKQIRKEDHDRNVYLFDAGDCMDGTPFSVEFLARADYDAMNAVGYDYGVFGNHDFNMTADQFAALRNTVKFPLVLANVYEKDSGKTPLPAYTIANWNGLKVAIFGLLTYTAKSYKAITQAYTERDPLDVAKELVPQLRKQADLVIAVTHDGLDVDEKMAQTIPGVDIIVGGHSHTRLPVGEYVRPTQPGPTDPKGTIILQDHQWVGELGRLDFTVTEGQDGHWRVTHYTEQLLPITAKIKEDPQVAKVVAGYWDKIKSKYGVVVAQATDEFVEDINGDSTNYYLVADVAQSAAGSQFDLENLGGVRAPILKGPVSYGDIVAVDPFDNSVYAFTIKGSDLKAALVKLRPVPSASLHYAVHRDTQTNKWVLDSATLDGKPIEDDTVYNGSANSYLVTHGLSDLVQSSKDLGIIRRNVLLDAVKKRGAITPTPDHRVTFGGANPNND